MFGAFGVLDASSHALARTMGASDRDIYYMEAFLSGLPLVGSYYKARDSVLYMDDYLSNRGLSYGSVKYPSMTSGYQGVSAFSNAGFSFVSANISKLYR